MFLLFIIKINIYVEIIVYVNKFIYNKNKYLYEKGILESLSSK